MGRLLLWRFTLRRRGFERLRFSGALTCTPFNRCGSAVFSDYVPYLLVWGRQTLHARNDDSAYDLRILSCTSLVRVHAYRLQHRTVRRVLLGGGRGYSTLLPSSNSISQRNTMPAEAVVRANSYTMDIRIRFNLKHALYRTSKGVCLKGIFRYSH